MYHHGYMDFMAIGHATYGLVTESSVVHYEILRVWTVDCNK